MIEKKIKISCTHTLKDKKITDGPIWRNWRIYINSLNRDHSPSLSNYIDHVEYILHESFITPRIVCYEEPYMIQQEGWGEFVLGIVFHFKQKEIPSQTISFGLNFSRPNYSKIKTLRINDTNTFIGSNNRARAISSSSDSSSIITTSSISSIAATPKDEDVFSLSQFLLSQKEQVYHNHSRSENQQINSCYKKNKHSRSTSHNNSSWNNNVVSEEIDIKKLANSLESLNDENLREMYNIMLKFDTSDMTIIETKDQVIFDLYSLSNPLLKKLWEFTRSLENNSL